MEGGGRERKEEGGMFTNSPGECSVVHGVAARERLLPQLPEVSPAPLHVRSCPPELGAGHSLGKKVRPPHHHITHAHMPHSCAHSTTDMQ